MGTNDAISELMKAAADTSRYSSAAEQLRQAAANASRYSSATEQLRQAAAGATRHLSAVQQLQAAAARYAPPALPELLTSLKNARHIYADLEQHKLALKGLTVALEGVDLNRFSSIASDALREMTFAREILAEYNATFRLPHFTEHARLMAQLQDTAWQRQAQTAMENITGFRRALESMKTPWLDGAAPMRSVSGLARLHEMGTSLRRLPAFDESLSTRLRLDLGDWREPIEWSTVALDTLADRTQLYIDRGFQTELTAFPAPAFEESLSLFGLDDDPADVADGENKGKLNEPEDSGFVRNDRAYALLQRLETHLRHFLDEKMTQAIGDKWIHQRVHGDVRKGWEEKREKAREIGEAERPLLCYADFGQYLDIIVRKDNWDAVFSDVFKHRGSVEESFRRLYPVRNCIAHSRLITADDLLYLLAESKRLLRAIRDSP